MVILIIRTEVLMLVTALSFKNALNFQSA